MNNYINAEMVVILEVRNRSQTGPTPLSVITFSNDRREEMIKISIDDKLIGATTVDELMPALKALVAYYDERYPNIRSRSR